LYEKIKSSFIDLADFASTSIAKQSFEIKSNSSLDSKAAKSKNQNLNKIADSNENDNKNGINNEENRLKAKKASFTSSSSRKRFKSSIGKKEMSLIND